MHNWKDVSCDNAGVVIHICWQSICSNVCAILHCSVGNIVNLIYLTVICHVTQHAQRHCYSTDRESQKEQLWYCLHLWPINWSISFCNTAWAVTDMNWNLQKVCVAESKGTMIIDHFTYLFLRLYGMFEHFPVLQVSANAHVSLVKWLIVYWL